MRPQKVTDDQLLTGLMGVLRAKGYDGASLNELADSCGLKKASLYHRFPGGKKDIGLAVLKFVENWKNKHIKAVINDSAKSPEDKLNLILDNIDQIYNSGKTACIMRALSMGSGLEMFSEELKHSTELWLNSLTQLGVQFGFEDNESAEMALKVLVKIQGSLVIAATLQNIAPFSSTLNDIRLMYNK